MFPWQQAEIIFFRNLDIFRNCILFQLIFISSNDNFLMVFIRIFTMTNNPGKNKMFACIIMIKNDRTLVDIKQHVLYTWPMLTTK